MHDFHYHGDELYCEEVPIEKIALEVGTPFYLYSHNTLERHFKVFDNAFQQTPHIICYSVKANSNGSILKIFARLGSGADIVSGGELFRSLKAGIPPQKIVYSGVGKTPQEIEYAIEAQILLFNVESPQELDLINSIAEKLGKKAKIAVRINPDIDPRSHPYISTGLRENKFGINYSEAKQEFRRALDKKNLEIIGIACHIGSQITAISPFVESLQRIISLTRELSAEGINITYLDLGGGLGITYNAETPPHPQEYAKAIIAEIQPYTQTLILEPGRVIVGNAGILVAKVLYTKQSWDKHFIIVDAAMNDLIRPTLYSSYQAVQPVKKKNGEVIVADIVGPICESGDFIAKKRCVPQFTSGDYLAIMSAGAYGFTMSSNYNSRLKPPEVLVCGDKHFVIRERESYEDLIRREKIPTYLQ